jgi:spore coat protein A
MKREQRTLYGLLWPATLTLAALGVGTAALADTITIGAAGDNTMYSEDGAQSNGAGNAFFAGRTDGGELRRALIRFDLTAIPAGSTINSVNLRLYCSRERTGAESIRLHRANSSWGEGMSHAPGEEGSGAPATPGDATWTYRFYDTTLWVPSGGDYVATASGTTSVNNQNQYYNWSSAGMAADVAAWVNSPGTNYGWIIIGNEITNQSTKRFESRQSTNASYRPALTVDYTPLAPITGACCFSGGNCQVRTAAECAAQGGSYQGDDTPCSPNPCEEPTGACCFANGSCEVLTSAACAAAGGSYQGGGSSCTPNPCPQPTGACCLSSGTCIEVTQASCTGQGGEYQGDGVACTRVSCPIILTPFVDPMPVAAVAQPQSGVPGGEAHYQIDMLQVTQQLHRDLPAATVWGYGGAYPGPTIEARRNLPVTVVWRNQLRDAQGNLRTTHYLPVDTCLHGPDETGQSPVAVVHLHGGVVAPSSDGYPEEAFPPGQQSPLYTYPNDQHASTIWYHDHALGITRLNVYMGLAGFYLIRDDAEDALNLPRGEYELVMAVQDRSFNPDGSLRYPAQWEDHFFGEFLLVNGKVWPYLNVKQGKYRFRIVNGSSSRVYTLSLSNGATFWQIGSDLGLLPAPVPMTSFTFTPGERYDIVVDFGAYPAGTEIILTNSAVAPYPNGSPESIIPNVLKFIVTAEVGDTDPLPGSLVLVARIPEAEAVRTRTFELARVFDPECNVDRWAINGMMWEDITEFPMLGTTEIWSWVNRSGMIHPMHLHLVAQQVLDRQDFEIVEGQVVPVGPRVPPPPGEAGWKDTVQAAPNQITRVITRFEGFTGLYPYHCHILEHEDHEMMRQFNVQPACAADFNADLLVNSQDYFDFLTAFFEGTLRADFNRDGVVNSQDYFDFLTAFFTGCA